MVKIMMLYGSELRKVKEAVKRRWRVDAGMCSSLDWRPEDTVGLCAECNTPVNAMGVPTVESCQYSSEVCTLCHFKECDGRHV